MKKELIDRLIGKDVKDISHWAAKYPARPEGQVVSRVGPSPTGFMHLGNIYAALIPYTFVKQNNGVFFVRIEDTDTKRKVEGAVDLIISSLRDFGIIADEGPVNGGYGPYFQSEREDIYKSGIKMLLEKDLAYPCFATEEDIEALRKEQTALKLRPGYYGKWAKCRNMTEEQIEQNLNEGKPYVFRFKANGNHDVKRYFADIVKGKIQMPENDMDIVIMKSDGLPTYHFAHVMDDHFMGTTHVIRADEWLASMPLHVQMFEAIGWKVPNYAHIAPIQKLDDGNRRKLSKRKDPEANISYYFEQGYPVEAVKEYLINLANSSFEDYKKTHPENALETFDFKLENLNVSGALLDFKKLENIAKEFIATLSSADLYERTLAWAKVYDQSFAAKLESDAGYVKSILAIERDGAEKVRKDYYIFSKINDETSYFFDDEFNLTKEEVLANSPLSPELTKDIAAQYLASYSYEHNKDEWFQNIKDLAAKNGFAKNPKERDKNPDLYAGKGTVSDIATIVRLLITGKTQTPDLHAIMQILGKPRTIKRLSVLA